MRFFRIELGGDDYMFSFGSSLETQLFEVKIGQSEKHVHTGPRPNHDLSVDQ